METEKIISTIREQIGKTDFSDRTIETYVSQNPVAEGQEPDENYFKKGAEFFKSLQGQYNADFSKKLSAKVEEFKKSYKPIATPNTEPSNEPVGIEERLKALEESNNAKIKEMEAKLEAKDKALTRQNYLQQVERAFKDELKDNGVVYDKVYFENITQHYDDLDTEKPVSDTVKTIREKYDALFKMNGRQSLNPSFENDFKYQPTDEKSALARREAYKQRLIKEGKLPDPNAQS